MSVIALQQIQHKVDVMIGGGKAWFAPLAENVQLNLHSLCVILRYYYAIPHSPLGSRCWCLTDCRLERGQEPLYSDAFYRSTH